MSENIKHWIEAMRLRTLPVSIAGVIVGTACAIYLHSFSPIQAIICLLFAVIAQIASNFANEYYDFKNGLDKKGREGFRRGVTEGDISPKAMRNATYTLLAIDAILGCCLLLFGPWWLILVGIAIGLFAIAYSTGPWPLSHHGLGDIAVIIFFGFVPVTFTCYLQTGAWDWTEVYIPLSIAVGLMGANVLMVNNYRDIDDDRAVNKHTTAVLFGRRAIRAAYLLSGIIAAVLAYIPFIGEAPLAMAIPVIIYLPIHIRAYLKLRANTGAALNPILGLTAKNLLIFALIFLIFSVIIS
jgi:1,4-dihydroxy-2-naphthoate octaprenyltransferase